jgi:ribosome-binding factor A
MSSRRVLKAAEAIREVVSLAILTDLRDPRVQNVTVTQVEVAGDMRQAKVHVSVMGDDAKQRLAIRGLESSAGYLQAKIAERIDTRYTPKLRFELDQGVKKSVALAQMLAEVLPRDVEPPAMGDDPDATYESGEADATPVEVDPPPS